MDMKIEIEGSLMKVTATQVPEDVFSAFKLLRIGARFGRYGFIPDSMVGSVVGTGTFVVTGYKD